jgi:hypothetical protein
MVMPDARSEQVMMKQISSVKPKLLDRAEQNHSILSFISPLLF